MSHLKATSGAVVHTQGHIDNVAPVIPRHKLGAADWAALDQHTQLAICVAAGWKGSKVRFLESVDQIIYASN